MGLIGGVMEMVFGGGRNAVAETVQVFRANAENEAARVSTDKSAALAQFAAEFSNPSKGLFDRVIDGVNRLPRPALALGTLGLFGAAMVDPLWFGERMAGMALIPEPLWWLMGAIVSFYFGARHQAKGQAFQRSIAAAAAAAPVAVEMLTARREVEAGQGAVTEAVAENATRPSDNPALDDWRAVS